MFEELEGLEVKPTGPVVGKVKAQAAFLAALVRQCGETLACGIADRSIRTFESWRDEDPVFQRCLKRAYDAASDVIVAEGYRRGVEGVPITIRDKNGAVVGVEQKFSDPIFLKLLQGLDSRGRFAKAAQNDPKIANEWRKDLARMSQNPEALELMERFADMLVNETKPD